MNDSCKNLGKNMHGGFECNENGNWSDKCIPFYCDIGYYYDTYEKRCKIDICINDPQEIEKILDGEYSDTIIINETNNTEYVFYINNDEYIYFFQIEGDEGYIHYDYNIPCPNLCIIQYPNQLDKYTIHLNYYRNATSKNIIVHISSVHVNPGSSSTLSGKFDLDHISTIKPLNVRHSFYVFEGYVDYAIYFQTMAQNTIIRMAEYNEIMNVMDIFSLNEKFFSDFNDKLLTLMIKQLPKNLVDDFNIRDKNISNFNNKEQKYPYTRIITYAPNKDLVYYCDFELINEELYEIIFKIKQKK